jgi:hypothetical protein
MQTVSYGVNPIDKQHMVEETIQYELCAPMYGMHYTQHGK